MVGASAIAAEVVVSSALLFGISEGKAEVTGIRRFGGGRLSGGIRRFWWCWIGGGISRRFVEDRLGGRRWLIGWGTRRRFRCLASFELSLVDTDGLFNKGLEGRGMALDGYCFLEFRIEAIVVSVQFAFFVVAKWGDKGFEFDSIGRSGFGLFQFRKAGSTFVDVVLVVVNTVQVGPKSCIIVTEMVVVVS